ncbi:MAG: AraC family transcriptional regulator [Alphaproteobacteria bacterium]|nr:AraC family transcriptional regulator [Alphaproteobacteria bacterium]
MERVVLENFGSRTNYAKRLARVTAYIYEHLDEDIDLAVLAEVAALSPWHWHRIYHALYGETVAATVRRLRLQRASGDLVNTTMIVEQIARRAGYETVPAFSRAFRAAYGMPPVRYREQGGHARFSDPTHEGDSAMFSVEIRRLPELSLAAINHIGPYMEIGRAFDQLYGTLAARGQITPGMRSIGVYLDDPSAVAEDRLRAQAAIVIDDGFTLAPPLEPAVIHGGIYAVLSYKGPYSDMRAAYNWLFGEWLVRAGHEADDAPAFEEYLNNPRDTPPTELRTDIHLKLREAPR